MEKLRIGRQLILCLDFSSLEETACKGSILESLKFSFTVDGGWSVWGSWSPCGKTCGGGVIERFRSCTNPPPFNGGKGCGSHYHESKECAVNKCPG